MESHKDAIWPRLMILPGSDGHLKSICKGQLDGSLPTVVADVSTNITQWKTPPDKKRPNIYWPDAKCPKQYSICLRHITPQSNQKATSNSLYNCCGHNHGYSAVVLQQPGNAMSGGIQLRHASSLMKFKAANPEDGPRRQKKLTDAPEFQE